MCLAVPGKIVAIKDNVATVDYGKVQRTGTLIEEGYNINDYVIIQGGVILMKIPETEAMRALELYNAIER